MTEIEQMIIDTCNEQTTEMCRGRKCPLKFVCDNYFRETPDNWGKEETEEKGQADPREEPEYNEQWTIGE